MKQAIENKTNRSRKGIALVVVLGFLAVLTIMAVGMAISMRTERLASSSHLDLVSARLACQSALAAAMTDLDSIVGIYPGEGYLDSVPTSTYSNFPTIFPVGSATSNYIPRSFTINTNDKAGLVDLGASSNMCYAYRIYNCSGLLDANYLLSTNYPSVTLSEIPDIDSADSFEKSCTNNVRYETVMDLFQNNNGLDRPSTNLFTFSYAPKGYYRNGTTNRPVYIGADINTWNKTNIEQAFVDAGFSNSEAGLLYTNLLDYVDSDSTPESLDQPSCEPIPMINEVKILTNSVKVEVWLPYVGPSAEANENFSIEVTMPSETLTASGNCTAGGNPIEVEIATSSTNTGIIASFDASLDVNGATVDEINLSNLEVDISKEVVDPRFNHDQARWHDAGNGTMGVTNSVVNSFSTDGDYYMYTANEPLRSIGELGYLPVSPWRTIKIYGSSMDPILDKLTIHKDDVRTGIVNPNTSNTNVLESVFKSIPIEPYFGAAGSQTINDDVISNEIVPHMTNASDFVNIGDVARSFQPANLPQLFIQMQVYPEIEKESIARYTSELFNPRQQLYTIILVGQRRSDSGNILAEQRAVAVVWRDPYPNQDGTRNSFVRFMRWLN